MGSTGSINNLGLALREQCPGLTFQIEAREKNVGLVTITLGPDTKITAQLMISLHKSIRELMPVGVDYEIETMKGTYTSRNTMKEVTPIPARRIKKDKNRKKYGAPWGF